MYIFKFDIDSGNLEIISDDITTVNGREAWVVQALGGFPSGNDFITIKFAEVMMHTFENIYIITYTNDAEDFVLHEKDYENVINSFTIAGAEPIQEEGGGCLIATATYGSELAPQVQQLRELRDNTVLQTESGTAFMKSFNQFYYSFSPTIADMERENPIFKETAKVIITPLVATLSILNYVNIDSEQEMLGYGIGIILMNIGMYFVAPAIVIYRLKK